MGIYHGVASFSRLYESFDGDPVKRGRQFERFVKWFLTVDPEWSTQVAQVWLWNDYPGRWGRDCGVDLVFRHKNGETWAVQAKCYSPDYEITKPDIDKFLSESNRKEIDHRLLIATTDRIGANARQVCEAQEKSVVRYHLSHFEDAAVDYPDSIDQLALGHRRAPPEPRPYQLKAIEEVCKGFQTANRGQLIMACGTGKTLVSMWVKERLEARRTLVLVPSLGLLSQILNDWTSASREPFEVLCVCSDQTAGRLEEDESIISVSDLSFPVTSNVSDIAAFLNGSGERVVFSTYQSSPLIVDVLSDARVHPFDLIVADEAHRCAGKVDGAFATVLDGAKLRATRRLFATATPRTYSSSLKQKADEIGVEVVGMDDEAAFGKRFHVLPFGEAIRQDLLSDYRVLIIGVDDETVADWIRNRCIVGTETGIETDAESLAAEIGLIKAIKDWDLQRIISFHSRVKRAERFAQQLREVCTWLDGSHKPNRTIWSEHVSGEMRTIDRRQKLQRLETIGEDEVGLLSNARCLSEGVDVPALDCVAFIDARSSRIDIVQAVGRAIRLSTNKKMGTIVIPVFIERADEPEEVLQSSNFKPIWEVVDALKAHDDVLSYELDRLRVELGSRARSIVGEVDLSKIVFDLPTSVDASFAQSLRTQLVAKTTESWMYWYGRLLEFKTAEGNTRVPLRWKVDPSLAAWVSRQRTLRSKGLLRADRCAMLDEIEFDWDPFNSIWETMYNQLVAYKQRYGDCNVPRGRNENPKLEKWVSVQRQFRRKNLLNEDRIARLDALDFDWDPFASEFEGFFAELVEFKNVNGDCRISSRHSNKRLARWAVKVRVRYRDGKLDLEKEKRLRAIGFDFERSQFDRRTTTYMSFDEARRFARSLGIGSVGEWFDWVRSDAARPNDLPRSVQVVYKNLGWTSWADFLGNDDRSGRENKRWNEMFGRLEKFWRVKGHCNVGRTYEDAKLARWVSTQRIFKRDGKLAPWKEHKLNTIGFRWALDRAKKVSALMASS
jgi:superfamily II DNA or RNA helicase